MKLRKVQRLENHCYRHINNIHVCSLDKKNILFHALSKSFICDIRVCYVDTIIYPHYNYTTDKWHIRISTTYVYFTSTGVKILSYSSINVVELDPNMHSDKIKSEVMTLFSNSPACYALQNHNYSIPGAKNIIDFVFKFWDSTNFYQELENAMNKYAALNLLNELSN